MKASWLTRGMMATALLLGAQSVALGDAVTLANGRRVEGQIVKDTPDELTINTAYGELHFLKVNLKSISRGGPAPAPPGVAAPAAGAAAAAPASDPGDPFSSAPAAAPAGGAAGDPFGAAPAPGADPFGGAPAAAPAAGGDPFGGGAPAAAPAGGSDPFGGGAPAAAPAPAPAAPPATAAGDPFKIGAAASTALPDNPFHPSGGAAPTAAAPAADPFGGGAAPAPAGAPVDPFGASAPAPAAGDPFGASAPAPAPAAAPAGGDPFSSSAAPAPAGDPFGAAPAAAAPAASSDPFGGGASVAASEPAPAGGDPFSTSSAPAGGGDPFGGGVAAAPSDSDNPLLAASGPSAPVDIQAAAPAPAPNEVAAAIPQFKPVERKAPPVVEKGRDGVVYGMTKDFPVEVMAAGKPDWAPAIDDTQLNVGSHIRTNKTRVSRLMLRNKTDELRLPDESHIELKELSEDGNEVKIFLHAGSIWSEVEHRAKPDSFIVQTPELTAGVRGTNFRVDHTSTGSRVSVFKGSVHVLASKTNVYVTLGPNQSAVVNSSGQIMDLIANPVDEQKIWDTWDTWAQQTTAGTGSIAAGFSPVGSLSQQIAQDNARWETDMQEAMKNTAELKYMDKLEQYADAFERFAQDTGTIPEKDSEAWSMLKFGADIPGWKGPYVEGPIPPADPYRNPLIYKKVVSPAGRVLGRVYSMWQDGRDQGGTNASVDKAALIMYYDLPRFKDDPAVNPKPKP